MKIFLMQWGGGRNPELFNVAKELEKKSHKIVYWLNYREYFPELKGMFPEAIFHDFREALAGKPAEGVDISGFIPSGEDLIEKMRDCESMVMTMMAKHYGHLSLSERKHAYYQLLSYWNGVFTEYEPDVIIFPMTPHVVPDFMVYSLAKLSGIKTLMFYPTEVSDRMILMEDFSVGSLKLKAAAEENVDKRISLDDLSEDLREYYKKRTGGKYVMPLSLEIFYRNFGGMNFFRRKIKMLSESISDLSVFGKAAGYISRQFTSNLKKEYLSVQQLPDFNEKFIYCPLQYQPEATTIPLGGIFADQRLMVETLAASVPADWFIYVREHPSQWKRQTTKFSEHRYRDYYAGLAKLKNVKIIPMEIKTYDLENMAQAVATNTGTAGWEAALKLKPTLTFGYPWYKFCPSVFTVSDVESCKQAIDNIINKFHPSEQRIINFLAALDKSSIHGYLEAHTKQLSKISSEEATANISEALIREIGK